MDIELADEQATEALGARLAGLLAPGLMIHVRGDLGAGKTTLVRGLLRALGVTGAVRSPTYTLIEPYELPSLRLYHLDLYRLADPEELEWLGLRDLLDGHSLCLIEWPERGRGVLPDPDLEIRLAHAGRARRAQLAGRTEAGKRIVAQLDAAGSSSAPQN